MNCVIVYDIANPRRLAKTAKAVEGFGRRVQLSVFEASLEDRSLNRLRHLLETIIDPNNDGVKLFSLCERCAQGGTAVGRNADWPDEGDVLVI